MRYDVHCYLFKYLVCGMNLLVQNHNHFTTAKVIIIFHGTGERNRGYALLMMANKSETALYRAPTFSLLLVSHGGITYSRSHGKIAITVHRSPLEQRSPFTETTFSIF